MKEPLVSVVIPCYKHEKFVRRSILSVLTQTYKNIELTVIDDGSPDGSLEVISSLSSEYDFRVVAQKNKGLIATLNDAIDKYVEGKYVCFLASDDFWPENKVELQVKEMEQRECAVLCYGNAVEVDNDDNMIREYRVSGRSGNVFNELFLDNFVTTLTVMMRTSALKSVGGYNPNICFEDWNMWLQLALKGELLFIDERLGFYRKHDSNMSHNPDLMFRGELQMFDFWSKSDELPSALIKKSEDLLYLRAFGRYCQFQKAGAIKFLRFFFLKPNLFFSTGFIKGVIKLLIRW